MEDKNQTNTTPSTSEGNATPAVTPATPVTVTDTPTAAPVVETVVPATPEVVAPAPETVTVPEVVATPVADVAVSTPAETVVAADSDTKNALRKAMLQQYAIAFGIILVMGVGVAYVLEQQGRIETHLFDKVTALVNPVPTAVVVNGVKIPLADYEKNKSQLEQAAEQSGTDVKSAEAQEQIKTQALDVLINTELLRQEAAKAGVTVTDEQVQARYDEIVAGLQGEDKLQARMAELGITKEGLLKDIAAEILIQAHLSKAIDTSSIKIDPKDIQAAYDQANTNPDSPLPPLDQVSSAIEAQLTQAQEQELIAKYLEKVRESATIEKKI